MNRTDKYVLTALWAAVGATLIWFVASGWSIYAMLWFFVLLAVTLAWWGLRLTVTERARTVAVWAANGFWVVAAVLLLFPFATPDQPQYVVGEVHRFSEPNHGFGRAFYGALGPNLTAHGLVYTDPNDIAGAGTYGSLPTFVTTFPFARATFGGNAILDRYRSSAAKGGDPVRVDPFPDSPWIGEDHRPYKLGWNRGDILLGDVAKQVGHEKATYTPHENTLMIKSIAMWLGSVDCGIASIDPRWFYSHDFLSAGTPLPLEDVKELKYAIQVFTDQNWTRVHNDPGESWWSVGKSGAAYSTSAWVATRMAQMLRDMGYHARVGFGGINYDTIETAISVYSGLGEYGRLSDAVVPSAGGLRFKSACVLTDFPMEPGLSTHGNGITRFCAHCDRCARACPVSSIPMGEPTVENGVKMWQVDKDKCVRFRAGNLNGNCCNECLRVCPYNKPDTLFHKLGVYMTRHSYLAPWLFGNVNAVGLEDWLDFEYSSESGDYNVNRPARWIQEEAGFTMEFPYMLGRYIYTEKDRSTAEDWSTGVGAKMGKIGLTYKGVRWGEIPERFFDSEGRHRNVHWDYEEGELPHDLKCPGAHITEEEAQRLLEAGEAFTGGWYKNDDEVFPPRSEKYEQGLVTYEEGVRMWAEEK